MRESVAARGLCKVGERRVYSSVMNCSFDNPKSSRSSLGCAIKKSGMMVSTVWGYRRMILYSVKTVLNEENRLKYYSLF